MHNPFGTDITAGQLSEDLGFLDDWEERYRYIIDLGKQLPPMDAALKNDETFLPGCQSQVWIHPSFDGDRLCFECDSDAFIVKGLLALVMAAYNGKPPADIIAFDIEGFFAGIGLLKHLSPTRGNGLRSMVKRIQGIARARTGA